MSHARATVATERCRDLIAKANARHPEAAAMGVEPRPGLEPLDVIVKFNQAGAGTPTAFQVVVQMKLSLDGSGNPPFTDAAGLVGQGQTEAEALEMFFNWMTDEGALELFRQTVKAHEAKQVDVLAEAELAKKRAEDNRIAARAADNNRNWAERKLDQLGRKYGFVKDKVQA